MKTIVAVEPSGPPFYDVVPIAMGEPKLARNWGIAYDHLTFDPPVTDPAPSIRFVRQALPGRTCWLTGNRNNRADCRT